MHENGGRECSEDYLREVAPRPGASRSDAELWDDDEFGGGRYYVIVICALGGRVVFRRRYATHSRSFVGSVG